MGCGKSKDVTKPDNLIMGCGTSKDVKKSSSPGADGCTKEPANVPEAMVRKLLFAKRKILEGCAAKDKSGLGLVTTAELSKQMQEIIGCSAEQADALVWSGGAWREIVPSGEGQLVDYKLFCLRVRLVDTEEAALLSALSNPDLQAARMAILERPSAFKELLSEFDGPVTAKQCEDILKEKGQHIMGKNHAAALCAMPGSLAAQKDFRVLAEELELVDTLRLHRSALLNMVILGCARDFAMLGDKLLKDARAASADRGNVLPADKFCAVFEKCDADSFCRAHSLLEAPKLPHTVSKSILTPILSAVTGALRQDLRVNFEAFASDLSIAHDSEIRILRSGRHETLQMLRRQVLKERAFIIKEMGSEQSLQNLKKIVMAKPLSFSEQDAERMCADVPKGQDGKQDVLKHIDKLQFSEILGTEIDECANALFAKYKELCSTCENKEPRGKEGSIRMEDFADAMDTVAVDNDMAKKVRQVLSDEGVELVAWRELLECRMRVLSWRELEILKRLRGKTDQTSRLKALEVSARVFVSLAEDTDDHDMVSFECVKAKFISLGSLSEDEAEKIEQMLRQSPLATLDKIHCPDVLGLRSYIASRDCDADAIKSLMSSRQRFLNACCGSEGSSAEPPPPRQSGPEVDVTTVRSAMHRVHLPAWVVDAVMGFADRAHKDQSKVQVGCLLSHMAVVTGSELRRLEMLADDRVQLARLALVKVDPTGGSCSKERLGSLVTELITKVS
jgi:flagellar biosynthesis regulator FlaF